MIQFLYHDKYIVVCVKPVGLLSEPLARERNLPALLQRQTGAYKIDVIHRLDRNVGGVMVYSKSRKATEMLAKMMAAHRFEKEYLAVAEGCPPPAGTWEDWLVKDKKAGKVHTAREGTPQAKYAKLEYTVLEEKNGRSLLRIRLHTGRTHQIRVQCASRGFPLVGDTKYGRQDTANNGRTPIALFACRLAFAHPITREPVECVEWPAPTGAFGDFRQELKDLAQAAALPTTTKKEGEQPGR